MDCVSGLYDFNYSSMPKELGAQPNKVITTRSGLRYTRKKAFDFVV